MHGLVLLALIQSPSDAWSKFAEDRVGVCIGQPGELEKPILFEHQGRKFEIKGDRLIQTSEGPDRLVIGVLSALKDDRPATIEALRALFAKMSAAGVDLIVANGDLAEDEISMEGVFDAYAGLGPLVLASVGNTESCGSFNRIAGRTFEKSPHFLNGNWIRRLELSGATLVTLPGYYDKRFVHRAGVPIYQPKHVEALAQLVESSKKPVVLISHGPPKMTGKAGIDIASGAGHVGDPEMAAQIEKLRIPFGIFGHILEAGGRGSDLAGATARESGKWSESLYVNAGTANPDPWVMLNEKSSYGMGLIVEIEKGKAKYTVLHLDPPKP